MKTTTKTKLTTLACACALVSSLSGCATPTGGNTGGGSSFFTDAKESPVKTAIWASIGMSLLVAVFGGGGSRRCFKQVSVPGEGLEIGDQRPCSFANLPGNRPHFAQK